MADAFVDRVVAASGATRERRVAAKIDTGGVFGRGSGGQNKPRPAGGADGKLDRVLLRPLRKVLSKEFMAFAELQNVRIHYQIAGLRRRRCDVL